MLLDVAGAARVVALADAGISQRSIGIQLGNLQTIIQYAIQRYSQTGYYMKWSEKGYKRCTSER